MLLLMLLLLLLLLLLILLLLILLLLLVCWAALLLPFMLDPSHCFCQALEMAGHAEAKKEAWDEVVKSRRLKQKSAFAQVLAHGHRTRDSLATLLHRNLPARLLHPADATRTRASRIRLRPLHR